MSADPRLARDPRLSTPQPPPPPSPPSPPPGENNPESTLAVSQQILENGHEEESMSDASSYKLVFCTVCASNNNRSMESHMRLALAKHPVISFGTGSLVRLPGPTITQPNVYPFNVTSYDSIYNELFSKDPRLYRQNGILNMLERNRSVKYGPERWQDWVVGKPRLNRFTQDQGSKGTEAGVVDVVITCEERCWDSVVDNLLERGSPLNRPVHVINVEIRDNHEEALVGGKAILSLADSLDEAAREEREKIGANGWVNGAGPARESFDQKVPEVVAEWQERFPNMQALWTLAWF